MGWIAISLSLFIPVSAGVAPPKLVSLKTDGGQITNEDCWYAALSRNGNIVIFESKSGGIVSEVSGNQFQVYRRDIKSSYTTLVSANASGVPAAGAARGVEVSDDGFEVAFASNAGNLVPGVSGGVFRLYVKEISTGAIECVSRSSSGAPIDFANSLDGHAMSGDARFVAFVSAAANVTIDDSSPNADVFVYDREADTVELISRGVSGGSGNGDSKAVRVSRDGRYVVFSSAADNLIANDTNDAVLDVFVHDRTLDTMTLLSRTVDGAQIDADTNLVGVSNNGKFIVVRTNATLDPDAPGHDLFLIRRTNGKVEAIGLLPQGIATTHTAFSAGISDDGRFIVFDSQMLGFTNQPDSPLGPDVYLLDRKTNKKSLLSRGVGGAIPDAYSERPRMSADGKKVVFFSAASNLVPADGDAFRDTFRVKFR